MGSFYLVINRSFDCLLNNDGANPREEISKRKISMYPLDDDSLVFHT